MITVIMLLLVMMATTMMAATTKKDGADNFPFNSLFGESSVTFVFATKSMTATLNVAIVGINIVAIIVVG